MRNRSLVLIAAMLSSACARHELQDSLTPVDRAAIRSLDSGFVAAWLRDDTAAVLRTFSPDAILLPPNSKPISGIANIRAYWWPDDGTHTRITGFNRKISEIEGSHHLAFIRGTGDLSWIYTKEGKDDAQTSRSLDLLIVEPDSAGKWHVIRQMWGILPAT